MDLAELGAGCGAACSAGGTSQFQQDCNSAVSGSRDGVAYELEADLRFAFSSGCCDCFGAGFFDLDDGLLRDFGSSNRLDFGDVGASAGWPLGWPG